MQKLTTDFLFGNGLALQEFFEFLNVFIAVKGNAFANAAVSTCPARFLVITFNGLRDVVVDDVAHIWFVDAHTKCDGSDNYLDFFHEKGVLVSGA